MTSCRHTVPVPFDTWSLAVPGSIGCGDFTLNRYGRPGSLVLLYIDMHRLVCKLADGADRLQPARN